jgi:RNA-directed DNA polymerase
VQGLLQAIREWLHAHKHATPAAVIEFLNPKLRGWANYHKRVNSKSTFASVDYRLWLTVWHWCLRRHTHDRKPKDWVKRKYFKRVNGRDWTFYALPTIADGVRKFATLFHLSAVPIVRHVKIKGANSPDDPSLHEYWEKRANRMHITREELIARTLGEGLS